MYPLLLLQNLYFESPKLISENNESDQETVKKPSIWSKTFKAQSKQICQFTYLRHFRFALNF